MATNIFVYWAGSGIGPIFSNARGLPVIARGRDARGWMPSRVIIINYRYLPWSLRLETSWLQTPTPTPKVTMTFLVVKNSICDDPLRQERVSWIAAICIVMASKAPFN